MEVSRLSQSEPKRDRHEWDPVIVGPCHELDAVGLENYTEGETQCEQEGVEAWISAGVGREKEVKIHEEDQDVVVAGIWYIHRSSSQGAIDIVSS